MHCACLSGPKRVPLLSPGQSEGWLFLQTVLCASKWEVSRGAWKKRPELTFTPFPGPDPTSHRPPRLSHGPAECTQSWLLRGWCHVWGGSQQRGTQWTSCLWSAALELYKGKTSRHWPPGKEGTPVSPSSFAPQLLSNNLQYARWYKQPPIYPYDPS